MKKRHHYIPIFYLKGFVDPYNEPFLWQYEKGCKDIKKVTAENIAWRKYYYSFTNIEGKQDSFEDVLAVLEGAASLIFKKIKNYEILNDQERGDFSYFLATMLTRVPRLREHFESYARNYMKQFGQYAGSNKNILESIIKNYEKDTGQKIPVSTKDLQDFLVKGNYDINFGESFSLEPMTYIKNIANIFFRMKWVFFEALDNFKFITSDNPIAFWDPSQSPSSFLGVGLLNKNIEVTFPISKDFMFLGSWKFESKNYIKANNNTVKDINYRTVLSAARFIFSCENSTSLYNFIQKLSSTDNKK